MTLFVVYSRDKDQQTLQLLYDPIMLWTTEGSLFMQPAAQQYSVQRMDLYKI
jgi:hypothetical protein